jgi:Tol biopolymer transport system component
MTLHQTKWKFLSFILFLLLVGCGPAGTPSQPVDENELATIVAATLTAITSDNNLPTPAATEATAATETPTETIPEGTAPPTAPVYIPPRALQVAYIKGGNVYIWTEGENSVGLTNTGDAIRVRISDDGQMIAYERRDPNNYFTSELWAVNTSGPTNARVLVSQAEMDTLKAASPYNNAPGMSIDLLAWRPKTHELYYSTVPIFEGPGYAPGKDVRMINLDTMEKRTIFDYGQGGRFNFSPDGGQIALSNPDHISLANADGSNLRTNLLTFPLVSTYSEYQYHPHPVWAADSGSLRVTIPPEDTLAEPIPPTGLWHIPTDGSPAVLLGSFSAIPFAWPDNAISPNLDRVVYAKSIGEPSANQRELHIANVDGSGDYIFITGGSANITSWTPDGTRFIFLLDNGSDYSMYLGTLATGDVSLIATIASTVQQMRWVDNSRFLFFHQYGGDRELRISHLGGTNHAFIDTIADPIVDYDFTQ